jgi:molybdate transport system ATP-binding protein
MRTVLVTHDRTDAISLGDQMAVLAEGAVRQVGAVADVFRNPADLVVAQSVGVESVVPARVVRVHEGLVDLEVGAAMLRVVDRGFDPARRDVFACIRAEDVVVRRASSTGEVGDSARNHLDGRIVAIEQDGPVEHVRIECGFPLVAVVTRSACEEMGLVPGGSVVAAVKATAVHLVTR